MSERLELVRTFGELRPSLLVVVKPCTWCGEAHRGMLLNPHTGLFHDVRGQSSVSLGFPISPAPGGRLHPHVGTMVIVKEAVAQGLVWRVEVPPAVKAKTRKLEKTR